MRKKRELHDDLPERSDPNYNRLYNQKNKERIRELNKKWREKQVKENPNYWSEIYDRDKALKYREDNKPILMEKNWKRKGIIDITYEKYQEELLKQNGKCKICEKEMNPPQVDHDHKTGLYRGLLCVACNNGLGTYEKNKEKFKKYLCE
jgi:Recombination endonuclease VII